MNNRSVLGGAAVAVPSEIFGLRLVWERHGRLPWTRLVLPAADLADGFAVGKDLARDLADVGAEQLGKFPVTAEIFLRREGGSYRTLAEGETCANSRLATTCVFKRSCPCIDSSLSLF